MELPEKIIPKITGLVDPKVERELLITINRIYERLEISDAKIEKAVSSLEDRTENAFQNIPKILNIDVNFPFILTTSTNSDPAIADYQDETWGLHKNTNSGNVYLIYNDKGTIKKVQLT